MLEKQKQEEQRRSLEAEDETSRRKAVAAKGGQRGSLLATSETGVSGANGSGGATAKKLGG